jgi:branched-chain amino acid transport system permease protein
MFWIIQTLNSLALGGLLFMLSAGFSLIFGLMRVPNMAHGALFALGACLGYAARAEGFPFAVAAIVAAMSVGVVGAIIERTVLRALAGNELGQVLATLGIAFILADLCLVGWGGDPLQVAPPDEFSGSLRVIGAAFPKYRLAVLALSLLVAALLWLMMDRTRLGAMIRAGVDDRDMARALGIRVSMLFTMVFCVGAALVGFAGFVGAPILSIYPGLDMDMLPLALIVVILGRVGSLAGAFAGSFVTGFVYTFGQAFAADLAYVVLFLPMVAILVLRPKGLFGRVPV